MGPGHPPLGHESRPEQLTNEVAGGAIELGFEFAERSLVGHEWWVVLYWIVRGRLDWTVRRSGKQIGRKVLHCIVLICGHICVPAFYWVNLAVPGCPVPALAVDRNGEQSLVGFKRSALCCLLAVGLDLDLLLPSVG